MKPRRILTILYGLSTAHALSVESSRTIKAKRIPTVDSDLLRFIDQQRQESETLLVTQTGESNYLAQYNRNKVALLFSNVNPQLAQQAGDSVQTHALTRFAKRRVREFLKHRDHLLDDNNQQTDNNNVHKTHFKEQHSLQETIALFNEYGLNDKDIATIFVHSPQTALIRPNQQENGETLETNLQRVFHLLSDTLGLRKYDARRIVRNTPGLLSKRGSHSATQVVQMLEKLGVSTNSIARDKNNLPKLLTRTPADIFRLVAFLSSDAVRMPLNTIGPLLRRPICQPLLDAVAPCRPDCNNDDEQQSDNESILLGDGRVLQRKQQINQIYRNMTETAWFLRTEIGTADLSQVVAAYPSVLMLDVQQILSAAEFLHGLGIKEELTRVLQLYPTLLGNDTDRMKEVVDYLESFGVSPESMASIFRSFPQLLTMKVEDMQAVVDYLESIGISNIGRFVTRLPPVLGYSVKDELQPKWEFLQTVCTDPRFELGRFPAYFSYPLERVIRQRFEYLRDEKKIPTQLVSIDQVLCFGDKDFACKVAGDEDHKAYQAFCESRKRTMPARMKRLPLRQSEN